MTDFVISPLGSRCLNAKLWRTIDLKRPKLKDIFKPFGGVYAMANGD